MLFDRLEPAQDLMMREDDATKREGDRPDHSCKSVRGVIFDGVARDTPTSAS